jgi:predicted nucleotidyltransferase
MDTARAVEIARRYADLARGRVRCDKAVLFGSHAEGRANEYSDIDVGFFVDYFDESENILAILKSLYRLALEVDVRIEPHVFIRSEDRTGFGALVEREGIPV